MALENRSDTFDIGGDMTVHRLGYGAMRLTGEDIIGRPDNEEEAHRVLHEAVSLGVDFIDTADSYGPCVSERLIGEALHPYPENLVVATKGGLLRNDGGDWLPNGTPDYLRNAVLGSLDRLGTDSIDLYQLHRPDPDVDFSDSIHALAELKDEGKIEHIGVSNVDIDQLDTARDIVEIATVQNQYNVANREHEAVLSTCEDAGIGFIPWYPLGAGDLGDKADALRDIANDHDASQRQIALAWLLHHSPVTLPIPGTSSVEHLHANIASAAINLSSDEMERLD
ncbi:aldo/keto reductase [Haladaptatus caseinilyticus]|uniref:aldo/keto reductase n=1 Tax=Haladaptatus caseinilyticus TaxID=2993314 RepID=UPI00224A9A93|nr:aldo/keto reductase [Haladaptatus caseinilyticus]